MKIKTNGTKYKVSIVGDMSNNMSGAFESNLRTVYAKYGSKIASISIDCSGKLHYKLTVVAKSGATEDVTFSSTNGNTVKVWMAYVNTFLKTA